MPTTASPLQYLTRAEVAKMSVEQLDNITSQRYSFKMQDGDTAALEIYQDIDAFWGYGLSLLTRQIYNTTATHLIVRIHSNGGDAPEAIAIGNVLRGFPGEVTAVVAGMAASAATIILVRGGKTRVQMAKNTFLMIHDPIISASGSASAVRAAGDAGDEMKNQIVKIYVDKIEANGKLVNGSRAETEALISKYMTDTKFFSADQALEVGLIDEIVDEVPFLNAENASYYTSYYSDFWDKLPQGVVNMLNQFSNKKPTKMKGSKFKNFLTQIKALVEAQSATDDETRETTLPEQEEEVPASDEAGEVEELEKAKALLKSKGYAVEEAKPEATPAPKPVAATNTAKPVIQNNGNDELISTLKDLLKEMAEEEEDDQAGAPSGGAKSPDKSGIRNYSANNPQRAKQWGNMANLLRKGGF
ncbi:MAG: hypothetical protein HC874_14245 [Richelia sp. SL_2_1]|nr:hypothetical protein [Richelia sp. SL_2_1]